MNQINQTEKTNVNVTYFNEEAANRPYLCVADRNEIIQAIKDAKTKLVKEGRADLINTQFKTYMIEELIKTYSRLSGLRLLQKQLTKQQWDIEVRGYKEFIPQLVEENF